MKFRFISAHRETFYVGRMCTLAQSPPARRLLCLAEASREPSKSREPGLEDKILVSFTQPVTAYTDHPKSQQRPYRRWCRCGENRVAQIMREAGIRSRTKKKFKATTNSRHNLPVAPNLLNQDFTVDAPDRTWVSDITYIHTEKGWLYLAVLLDLFNREIVGWATSSRMTRQLAIDALQMALGRRTPAKGLVHHSDRGSQYASGDYQKILSKHGITCSMSRKGNCYDNAVAESYFSPAQNRMGIPLSVPQQVGSYP